MHAGSSEASIIAALFPESVAFMGKRTNPKFAPTRKGAFTLFKSSEITKLGILNFSPELEINSNKGRELFDFTVNNLIDRIKEGT